MPCPALARHPPPVAGGRVFVIASSEQRRRRRQRRRARRTAAPPSSSSPSPSARRCRLARRCGLCYLPPWSAVVRCSPSWLRPPSVDVFGGVRRIAFFGVRPATVTRRGTQQVAGSPRSRSSRCRRHCHLVVVVTVGDAAYSVPLSSSPLASRCRRRCGASSPSRRRRGRSSSRSTIHGPASVARRHLQPLLLKIFQQALILPTPRERPTHTPFHTSSGGVSVGADAGPMPDDERHPLASLSPAELAYAIAAFRQHHHGGDRQGSNASLSLVFYDVSLLEDWTSRQKAMFLSSSPNVRQCCRRAERVSYVLT